MIEQTIWCFMTSQDAKDLVKKLEEIEKANEWGGSLLAKSWHLPKNGTLHTKINFAVDQDRAYQQGLIKCTNNIS